MAAADALTPRAALLSQRMAGADVRLRFADLNDLPGWARRTATERAALARLAALAQLAPRLARTADGRVLGAVAGAVGPESLDWAIALGEGIAFAEPLTHAPDLDRIGQDLLAATLPPALRPWFTPGAAATDPARAARALDLAEAALSPGAEAS